MKKILFLVTTALVLFACNDIRAQPVQPYGALTVSGASLSNTDTAYAYNTVPIDGAGSVSISATATYVSGTMAGGAWLFVSNDGTNFVPYSATDTMILVGPITFNGVTQITKVWTLSENYYRYYRVRFRQTGTAASTASGTYTLRRESGYR